MPTVSVIIPSYNHEKFVKECIQSVLDQTYQDFEIIITDDCSIDNTVHIIEQFDDPRIRLFRHKINRGVSVTANHCIFQANGKYIAWLSSDDAWYPNKLEKQVQYLDEHPSVGVVFGKVDWIDESGNLITDPSFPYLNIYDVENQSRQEWLRYFFLSGNCLSLPSSLIRQECFSEVGLFNPVYTKIQDLDIWIKICFKFNVTILDQRLIRNRWINDENNASGDTIKNRIQVRFEYKTSLEHYLQINTSDELLSIFPHAEQYGEITNDTIPYTLGRIAIDNHLDFKMLWGLELIYRLLQDERLAEILKTQCDFTYLDFIKLSNECDLFNLRAFNELDKKSRFIETLIQEREILIQERETLIQERETLIQERETLIQEIEKIKSSRSWLFIQRLRQLLARFTFKT
jgi:glycosyltransferase involved in cell wall biosynthesis